MNIPRIDVDNLYSYKSADKLSTETHRSTVQDIIDVIQDLSLLVDRDVNLSNLNDEYVFETYQHVHVDKAQVIVGQTEEKQVYLIIDTYYFEVVNGRLVYHLIKGGEIDMTDDPTSAGSYVAITDPECPPGFYFSDEFVKMMFEVERVYRDRHAI